MIDNDFISSNYPKFLAFAQSQLQDATKAEDVVQEALMSAMQYKEQFRGNSALKTWIFAILKNKILDELRRSKKMVVVANFQQDDELMLTTLFNQSGRWQTDNLPIEFDDSWQSSNDIEAQDFWNALEFCLQNLSPEQAKVFMMREYMELDTEEVCQHCNISRQNFYVLMHRARLRLQYCLRLNWFDI